MPQLKINQIKYPAKEIEVEGVIEKKEEAINPRVRHYRAVISDETGKIGLDLWREQIDQVDVGDRILLKYAFTKRIKRRVMLNTWEPTITVLEKKSQETSN